MSRNTAALRLQSDWRSLQTDPPDGASASPLRDENLFVWGATIFGPEETPWEGGVFELRMVFPPDYPTKPPRVTFVTEMFHPNVYGDGSLCLDLLQDKWSPAYSVSTILVSIQSLLTDPNPDSPANPIAARLYSTDKKGYNKKVRSTVAATIGC